ncbi:uncharacterized protein METZ01_LOCUS371566 [marine metagenome]|uniref:DUF805 domain-containing protein n=1 Tax=marine metagenome TaxID=408172 RepID=A0A382TAA4_9ZZZZ
MNTNKNSSAQALAVSNHRSSNHSTAGKLTFTKAIKTCFGKYTVFEGRASRSEFWYFFLFANILVPFTIGFIEGIFFPESLELAWMEPAPLDWLLSLFYLFIFLPYLAVYIRRLHDTNHSGWWILIYFTIIGIIPLLIWLCTSGDEKNNEFGQPVLPIS